MSDIVTRLRFTEFRFEPPMAAIDLMEEAADEIERLTAEAVRLRNMLELASDVLDHHRHHYDADYFRSQKESTPCLRPDRRTNVAERLFGDE